MLFVTDVWSFWLGLSFNENGTQFEWINESCDLSSFEDWYYYHNGELDNYCVQMYSYGWYTEQCRYFRSVVCEFY